MLKYSTRIEENRRNKLVPTSGARLIDFFSLYSCCMFQEYISYYFEYMYSKTGYASFDNILQDKVRPYEVFSNIISSPHVFPNF